MKNTLLQLMFWISMFLLFSCAQERETQVEIYISAEKSESYSSVSGTISTIYLTEVDEIGNYVSVNTVEDIQETNFLLDLDEDPSEYKVAKTSLKTGYYNGVRLHIPAFAIVDDNGVEILAFSDENPSSQSCCNDFELEPNKDYSMHIRYDFDSLLQAAEFGIWSDSNVEVFLSEL